MNFIRKIIWFLFVFLAIGIGLYPLLYSFLDMSQGLLGSKSPELQANVIWNTAFRLHIFLGGLTLLVGWSQFSKKLRTARLSLHRTLGKIYLISAFISGVSGLYIAFFATGGLVAQWGFGFLAVSWLSTTFMAYSKIKALDIVSHQQWMTRSYALAFAAVMLRVYLPFMQAGLGMEFIDAYRIVAWICWVPNLLVAEWIIRSNY